LKQGFIFYFSKFLHNQFSKIFGIVVVSLFIIKIDLMPNVALWVQLEAEKGKEAEVEKFLRDGLPIVNNEPGTITWYALKLSPTSYAIFDTFSDNKEREAHLAGEVAKALKEKASELFSKPPTIERIDILAAKMPELQHH